MRLASLWPVWLWLQNFVSTVATLDVPKEPVPIFVYTADHAFAYPLDTIYLLRLAF